MGGTVTEGPDAEVAGDGVGVGFGKKPPGVVPPGGTVDVPGGGGGGATRGSAGLARFVRV